MLIASVQSRIGQEIAENLSSARNLLLEATNEGAIIACLPEYFSFPRMDNVTIELVEEVRSETITFLETISTETSSVVVGGTIPEASDSGYRNVCYIFDSGKNVACIEKEKVTIGERRLGIVPGTRKDIFKVDGVAATARICADILFPETCFDLRNKINLLFVPLISPVREKDPTRTRRDCLFIVRAFDANCYVIKAGAVGAAPLTGHSIAGRSLITAPHGVLAKSPSENKELVLIEDLDFDALSDYDIITEMFPGEDR
ncbi:MAG: carbon-nitrogen hydrolase family protein [Candidatus Heimdallarchaeota archaeon]